MKQQFKKLQQQLKQEYNIKQFVSFREQNVVREIYEQELTESDLKQILSQEQEAQIIFFKSNLNFLINNQNLSEKQINYHLYCVCELIKQSEKVKEIINQTRELFFEFIRNEKDNFFKDNYKQSYLILIVYSLLIKSNGEFLLDLEQNLEFIKNFTLNIINKNFNESYQQVLSRIWLFFYQYDLISSQFVNNCFDQILNNFSQFTKSQKSKWIEFLNIAIQLKSFQFEQEQLSQVYSFILDQLFILNEITLENQTLISEYFFFLINYYYLFCSKEDMNTRIHQTHLRLIYLGIQCSNINLKSYSLQLMINLLMGVDNILEYHFFRENIFNLSDYCFANLNQLCSDIQQYSLELLNLILCKVNEEQLTTYFQTYGQYFIKQIVEDFNILDKSNQQTLLLILEGVSNNNAFIQACVQTEAFRNFIEKQIYECDSQNKETIQRIYCNIFESEF